MKKLVSALLLLSIVIPEPAAWPALQPSDKQFSPAMAAGIMANPGFEFGVQKWTASGGTLTTTTTAANVFAGNAAGSWDSNSAGQTLTTTITYTNGGGPTLTNQVAGCMVKCDSGTCTHTFTVDDGSTNLATPVTITSSTTGYVPVVVNFTAGTGGTLRPKFTSVASNEPIIYVDGCWTGAAGVPGPNFGQVNQASLVASGYFAPTGSCTWTRTSSTLGGMSTTAACPGATVETNNGPGSLQTTDYDLPKFTINALPPGTYEVCMTGAGFIATSAQEGAVAINDGTTTSGQHAMEWQTTGGHWGTCGVFTYTTAANQSWQVYVSSAANQITLVNNGTNEQTYFTVKRFPNAAQTYLQPNFIPYTTISRVTTSAHTGGFPSNTTGTYTTPLYASEIMVCGVGAGGGGGNAGTTTTAAATDGAATTFGTSLISLPGGAHGTRGNDGGAGGGAPTINSPATTVVIGLGSQGGGSADQNSATSGATPTIMGSNGGASALGGAGGGGSHGGSGSGGAAAADTGSGGGGGQISQTNSASSGSGGGSGTYACALITNPAATYSYTVGGKGSGATGGSFAGGAGADGQLWIIERYGVNTPVMLMGVYSPQNTSGATVINNYVSKSSTYTLTALDETVAFTATSTANIPNAATMQGKRFHIITDGATAHATITPAAGTICGSSSIVLSGNQSIEIQADGTNWKGLNNGCYFTGFVHVASTCSSTPCTITDQNGDWVSSLTRSAAGSYTVNFTSGVFSVAPTCVKRCSNGSNVFFEEAGDSEPSTSSWATTNCYISSVTATDARLSITCTGKR